MCFGVIDFDVFFTFDEFWWAGLCFHILMVLLLYQIFTLAGFSVCSNFSVLDSFCMSYFCLFADLRVFWQAWLSMFVILLCFGRTDFGVFSVFMYVAYFTVF